MLLSQSNLERRGLRSYQLTAQGLGPPPPSSTPLGVNGAFTLLKCAHAEYWNSKYYAKNVIRKF